MGNKTSAIVSSVLFGAAMTVATKMLVAAFDETCEASNIRSSRCRVSRKGEVKELTEEEAKSESNDVFITAGIDFVGGVGIMLIAAI